MEPSKTVRAKTEMWERRYKAFELHKAGYTERQIAGQLNVSPPTAHKDIRAVLEQLAPSEGDVERMRTTQNHRYMQMLTAVWVKVVGGDQRAIETAYKIMTSINVINGLNKAPTGLPGSDNENPLWLTFTQLAQSIPVEVIDGEAKDVTELDDALEGMYEALDSPEANGSKVNGTAVPEGE